ncbi:MAG TPA: hypothetical protein VF053_09000 [Streptosporangiales bacterium]
MAVASGHERYRRRRLGRVWFVAACTGTMALLTGTTQLSLPEKVLGCLFWSGTCVAAVVTALRLGNPRTQAAKWAPRWYDGPYRGGRVRGVAIPVQVADHGVLPWAMLALGLVLLAGAVYIGVSGHGVDGGTGVRVVATVLCAVFGLILALGGPAMRVDKSPDSSLVVLSADAVHLPRPGRTALVRWDDLARAEGNPRGGPMAGAAGNRLPGYVLDLVGAGGERLARLPVSDLPDPSALLDTLNAARQDPGVRQSLETPAGLLRFGARAGQ